MGISARPDREGSLRLPDGRRVTYAEWGDLEGRPVVLLHGNPGSRLICPDLAESAAAGVRVVTIDRAGCGGSDPSAGRDLEAAAADLAEVLTQLELAPCPVLGWSAGGAFALAVGAFHPELVTSIGVLATLAPPDEVPGAREAVPDDVRVLLERARAGDPDVEAELHERGRVWTDDPAAPADRTIANTDDPDHTVMARPEVREALVTMWTEAARQGTDGYVPGWCATWALPWGFALADLRVPVTVWHGTGDVVLPVEHGRFLAEHIDGAQLRLFDGEGHLFPIGHWAEILAHHVPSSPTRSSS